MEDNSSLAGHGGERGVEDNISLAGLEEERCVEDNSSLAVLGGGKKKMEDNISLACLGGLKETKLLFLQTSLPQLRLILEVDFRGISHAKNCYSTTISKNSNLKQKTATHF